MRTKEELADILVSGVAGWFQHIACQHLAGLVDEDTARMTIVQLLNAQNQFAPVVDIVPPNWKGSKKRIDVGLKGTSTSFKGLYGAIELKWPGQSDDPHECRLSTVQDAIRVAFVETHNLSAHFVLLAGESPWITTLFDKPHPQAQDREDRRVVFSSLFSRDLQKPCGEADNKTLIQHFPKHLDRVPLNVANNWNGKLTTELLSKVNVCIGKRDVGNVFVWHCTRVRGRKQNALLGSCSSASNVDT